MNVQQTIVPEAELVTDKEIRLLRRLARTATRAAKTRDAMASRATDLLAENWWEEFGKEQELR